jgi:beta-xylosidase
MRKFAILLVSLGVALSLKAQKPNMDMKEKGFSGNPVFEGWYADPEGTIFGNEYWIYPTFSDYYGDYEPIDEASLTERQKQTINKDYLKQTFLDAFSSKDLINWTKHQKVLDIKDVSWAAFALWAPAIVHANNKYYLLFGANDIQKDSELGGIGVAVADCPEGPFKDALGKPLIDKFHNGAQPIDQFVFRDDDGQFYMYYGGWRHCNIVKLSNDLLSVVPFDDGTTFKEVTPDKYVEGPFMFKRQGKYYFMWSEGGWTGPDYSVAYAIADSPFGPFQRIGKILQQDPKVASGAGHHSVIQIPGTDEWYIVYHRRPLGVTNGNYRETCIDRMYFNSDGTIQPVKITFKGVSKRELVKRP